MRIQEVLKTPTAEGDDYPDENNQNGDHEISVNDRIPTVVLDHSEDQKRELNRSVDQCSKRFSEMETYMKRISSIYGIIDNSKPNALELSNVFSDGKQDVAFYLHRNFGIKYKEERLKHGDAHQGAFEPLTDDGGIKIKLESLRDPEVAESGITNAEENSFKVVRDNYILKSKPLKLFSTGTASDDASGMREDSESLGSNGIIDGNVASSVTSNGTLQPFKQNLMKNGSKFSEEKLRVRKKSYKASIGSLLTHYLGFLFFFRLFFIASGTEILKIFEFGEQAELKSIATVTVCVTVVAIVLCFWTTHVKGILSCIIVPTAAYDHKGLIKKCKDGNFKRRILSLHLLLFWICLCSCMKVADGTLEKVPRNTVSYMNSGKETKMECWSDLGYRLKWFMQSNSSSERKRLYSGYFLHSEASSYCHVENGDPGKYTLNLTSIEEAAQTYTCLEPGSLQEASAELILIGETKCEGNSVDSYIKITCSVPFRGNWAPVLEWKHNEVLLTDNVTSIVVFNREVTSTIFLPSSKFGASNYACTTKFNIGGKPRQTTDNSVPSYTYVWNISADLFASKDEGIQLFRNDKGTSRSTPDIDGSENSDRQVSSPTIIIIIPLVISLAVVCVIVAVGAVLFKRLHRKLPKWKQGENCKQNSSLMGNNSDVTPSA